MTRHVSKWYSVETPEGWIVEEDAISTSFYQPAGVGVLQISVLHKESEEVTDSELQEIVAEQYGSAATFAPASLGPLTGLHGSWQEGDTAWRTWLLRSGRFLFFVTYNCGVEDAEAESQAVHEILESISLEA